MSRDPSGYYNSLGVSPDATKEQIKKIYRSLAKIYHPDINDDPHAAEKFKKIAEAYEILINDDLRARYDRLSEEVTSVAPEEPAREKVQPIRCSTCEKVTAQPRFLVFRSVVSYVFATQTNPVSGIFCSSCAKKKALKASAIASVFGWWGVPWGPINTIKEVIRNSLGGEKNPDIDEKLLWQNAVAFLDQGNFLLSGSIAQKLLNAKDSDISSAAAEILYFIQNQGIEPKRIKKTWQFSFRNFASQIVMVSAIPSFIAAAIYSESLEGKTASPSWQNNYIQTRV
ncbi:J domain-containing protein [Thalassospira lucentensis]|uniref:J domain-containing protein n=1 Tax=Thalassospira lucentensis TaxID=168935 RepID=UPI003D2CEAD8